MSDRMENILKKLNSIENLPTIGVVATQLIEAVGDPNTNVNQISKLVSMDPSLTAKVLRIANSSYYALRKKVDTIHMALVILGLNEVSNLVLSISIFDTLGKGGSDTNLDYEEFWLHSARTAHFCRVLARALEITMHGEEFTAGLIHDIGKIVLDQYFKEEFIEIKKGCANSSAPNYVFEEAVLGINHMDLGAWLSEKWKFPAHLVESIRYHHYPQYAQDNPVLTAIVFFADKIANSFKDSPIIDYKKIFEAHPQAWDILYEEAHYACESLNYDDFAQKIKAEEEAIALFLAHTK